MPIYNTVRSVRRAFVVLQALNRSNGTRPQQLADAIGIPRSTVYRMLETLQDLGFVARSPSDDTWHVTLLVRSLSDGFVDDVWIRQCALPVMETLCRELLWPIDLHTYEVDCVVVRESTHRSSPFSIDHGMVGARLPLLLTSSGRAHLAFCPDGEREAILERLRRSERDEDRAAGDDLWIGHLLEATRKRGFGLRAGEFRPHTNSLSMPVTVDGRVLALLTVIWIASAMPLEAAIGKLRDPMLRGAEEIARRYRSSRDGASDAVAADRS